MMLSLVNYSFKSKNTTLSNNDAPLKIPPTDENITASPGDIVLYQSK